MYQSTYKYSKVYTILWLLLAASPVALGKKKPPATQHKVEVHDAQPQENNLPTRAVPAVKTLTTAQQQWLSNAFKAKDSDKKRFEKLLGGIDHQEAYVREAVFQTLHQLLTNNPKLASKNGVNSVRKVLHKVDTSEEAKEALQLLCVLVKSEPRLALAASKVVMDLASNGKDMLAKRGVGLDMLLPLTQTVIDTSPKCLDYLLHSIHKNIASVDANCVTVQRLLVTHRIFSTDMVQKNSVYLNKTLDIFLDANRSKDDAITKISLALLAEIMQQHPSLAKNRFNLMLELVQEELPNMYAMEKIVTFSTVDHSLRKQVISLLINIFRTTDSRIRRRTAQNYANSKSHGLLIDAIFSKSEKKQAAQDAQNTDDHLVRVPALRLLEKIVCVDPSYLPEVFATLQKCTEEHERSLVKREALNVLACVVKNNYGYTPEIVAIANKAVQDKEAYIKEAALGLLSAILGADDEYTTNQEISENIQKLSQDKHVKVRQLATDLLNKYSLAAR